MQSSRGISSVGEGGISEMCLKTGSVKEEQGLSDRTTGLQVLRSREPNHFMLKVESFSKSNEEKYVSNEFKAGGYKWKLIFYPNGDKRINECNHISLYLSISDTKNLPQGFEVEADFSLFVYNYLSEQYLTCKLANATRFNWLKMESGFAQFIALDHFKETSNGYLFDDNCVLGAEVTVIATSFVAKRQTLSMNIKKIKKNIFTWKVDQFFSKKDGSFSYDFENGGVQWELALYPKGYGDGKDKYTAVYLCLAAGERSQHPANWKAYAEYKIRIRNQINNNHIERLANFWFSSSTSSWGYDDFMELNDLNDKSKGYVVNDTLLVEIEFNVPIRTKADADDVVRKEVYVPKMRFGSARR